MAMVNLSGASDSSTAMLAELPEALSLKPQSAIIATYRNDLTGCVGARFHWQPLRRMLLALILSCRRRESRLSY